MKELENNLVAAALNLAGATMSHAALLPIPNTTPQLYVGYGEAGQLMVDLAATQPERSEGMPAGEARIVNNSDGEFLGIARKSCAPAAQNGGLVRAALIDLLEVELSALNGTSFLAKQTHYRALFARARAALASEAKADAAPVVPEGFVLAPIVPTPSMLAHAVTPRGTYSTDMAHEAAVTYRIMIGAAPKPATPPATVSNTTAGASIGYDADFINLLRDWGNASQRPDTPSEGVHRAFVALSAYIDARRPAVGMVAAPELSEQADKLLRSSVPDRWKGCASAIGAVQGYIGELEEAAAPDLSVCDAERLAFLHSTNKDEDGWEFGVARVRWDAAGKAEVLWGLSDHSDIDAAIRALRSAAPGTDTGAKS